MLRVIALVALVAMASASCPNDCSHHGTCNIFSACDCYRNWMGADCSERVCPFGHAFVDTPQGDLNSDGRIDRSDVRTIIVSTDLAWDATFATAPPTFKANVFLFSENSASASGVPSFANSHAVVISEAVGYEDGSSNTEFALQVVTSENEPVADIEASSYTAQCALIATAYAGATYGSDDCASMIVDPLAGGATTITFGAVSAVSTTYNTQFTNQATWELFPSDHGIGILDNTLVSYWDEGHFYSECSGKGQCDRTSGECQCFAGYMGAGCSRTSCPNDCSGHGVCSRLEDVNSAYNYWDSVKTQQCVCDPGYSGIDCAQRICPSGDDPITKPESYSASGATISETLYHISPQKGGQVTEIQYFGHVGALDSTFTNVFALEFTDEFGDKWTTKTLNFGTATAADVEAALEALPNSVVQNVEVSYSFIHEDVAVTDGTTTGGVADGDFATCAGQASSDAIPSAACAYMPRSWAVTFISNSGNIPQLGMRYSVQDDSQTRTETHDSNGGANVLVKCADPSQAESAGGNTAFCSHYATGNSGADLIERSAASFGWMQVGTTATNGAASFAAGDETVVWEVTNTAALVFTSTGRDGSQENDICSNRGLCDYESGLCQCFNGFTDDDCSRQNALAMY